MRKVKMLAGVIGVILAGSGAAHASISIVDGRIVSDGRGYGADNEINCFLNALKDAKGWDDDSATNLNKSPLGQGAYTDAMLKALTIWDADSTANHAATLSNTLIDAATPYAPTNTPTTGNTGGSTNHQSPGTGGSSTPTVKVTQAQIDTAQNNAIKEHNTAISGLQDDVKTNTDNIAADETANAQNHLDTLKALDTAQAKNEALTNRLTAAEQKAAERQQQQKTAQEHQRIQQQKATEQAHADAEKMAGNATRSAEKRAHVAQGELYNLIHGEVTAEHTYTDTKAAEAVTTANSYTDNAVNNVTTTPDVDPSLLNDANQNQSDAQALNGNHGNSAPTSLPLPSTDPVTRYLNAHQNLYAATTQQFQDGLRNAYNTGGAGAANNFLSGDMTTDRNTGKMVHLPDFADTTNTNTPASTNTNTNTQSDYVEPGKQPDQPKATHEPVQPDQPAHVKLASNVRAHEAQAKDDTLREAYAVGEGKVVDHVAPATETQAEKGAIHQKAVAEAEQHLAALKAQDDAKQHPTTKKGKDAQVVRFDTHVTPMTMTQTEKDINHQNAVNAAQSSLDSLKVNEQAVQQTNTVLQNTQRIDTNQKNIETTHEEVIAESHARYEGDRETLQQSESYTDQKVNSLKSEIQDNRKRADAGAASGLAAVGIPGLYGQQNWNFGAGVGTFGDAQAVAVGGNYKVTEHVALKVGATASPTTQNYGGFAGVAIGG